MSSEFSIKQGVPIFFLKKQSPQHDKNSCKVKTSLSRNTSVYNPEVEHDMDQLESHWLRALILKKNLKLNTIVFG